MPESTMGARFYLLGRLRFQLDLSPAQVPEMPRLRKARALLAYLLLFRDRSHSREKLAALFWGDVSDKNARDSLTTALRTIRSLIQAAGLELESDRYDLQLHLGSAWLDVAELERGLAPGADNAARATALDLYRGELLSDWQDEWVVIERERLRRRVLDAGAPLLRYYLSQQLWSEGIALAEQLLPHDELDSALRELLISLLLGAGQRDAARRQLQEYEELMRAQLGVDPPGIDPEIYRRIALSMGVGLPDAGPPSADAAPAVAGPMPFAGRAQERAIIGAALNLLRQGQGGLLLVRGEAGIGKTRLVEEALTGTRGLHVAHSRVYELDQAAPFGMLLRPLAAWLLEDLAPAQVISRLGPLTAATLAQLIPALSATLPGLKPLPALPLAEAQAQLVQALVAALLAAGKPPGAPAVLFLDDLHFADAQSLLVLGQLHPRLANTPLLVIATYRAEEVTPGSPLDQLLRDLDQAAVQTIKVQALSADEVQAIIEPRQADPRLSRWLYQHGGGNPFFLAELLNGLAETGQVAADPTLGGWYMLDARLPSRAAQISATAGGVVLRRFHRMSPHAQAITQVAAVATGESDFGMLKEVSGLEEVDALNGLEEATARRFLVQTGDDDRYAVAHDLIRAAIYEALSQTRRRYLHGRIAVALEATGSGDAELVNELAFHYGRSANRPKQREYFWRAAESALDSSAYETAIDYYQELLKLLTPRDQAAQRLETYRRLAAAMRAAGRNEQAAVVYDLMRQDGAALNDPLAQARALNGLSATQSHRGDPRGALDSARRAALLARAAHPPALGELALALVQQGWVFYYDSQLAMAAQLGSDALMIAEQAGDKATSASALNLLGSANEGQGQREAACRYFERALLLARELGHRRREVSLLTNLGSNRYWQGNYSAAYAQFRRALALAVEIDSHDAEMLARGGIGATLAELGDLLPAELELRRAIDIAESAPSRYALPYCQLALAKVLVGRKRLAEALECIGLGYRLGEAAGDLRCLGIAWRMLALLLAHLPSPARFDGQYYDAPAAFSQSLRIFAANGPADEQARTLAEWSRFEQERGQSDRAAELRVQARQIFAQMGLTAEIERLDRQGAWAAT